MSIVGTRPPLIGEVSEYELHHRARLAIKPGITGMWQVSGRSDITDFEEVVELDKEYIENWNILYNLRNKTKLNIEEVWMNHGKLMGKNTDLSVRQNDEVYTALKEQGITIKPALAGMTYDLDGAVFRILWPNEETLYRLFPKAFGNVPLGKQSDYGYSLEELMNLPIKGKDASPSNRASIIMEVEYKGQKLLFTGDAWAEDILEVAGNKSYDFMKLSHHGSVRNLSEEWCGRIRCQTYMICTVGKKQFKETIAFTEALLQKSDLDERVKIVAEVYASISRAYVEDAPVEETIGKFLDEKECLNIKIEDMGTEALVF